MTYHPFAAPRQPQALDHVQSDPLPRPNTIAVDPISTLAALITAPMPVVTIPAAEANLVKRCASLRTLPARFQAHNRMIGEGRMNM
jgi:hypothetical protein